MLLWDTEVYSPSSLVVEPFDHVLFKYVVNRIFEALTSCGAINIAAN